MWNMMCDVMPTIAEDSISQRSSQYSGEDANFEQLMVSMLDERDKLVESLRESQERLQETEARLQEVEKERDSLNRQLNANIPQNGQQSVDKFHIRHLMLYEIRKHDDTTNATNAINVVYPGALNTRTCQRWFKKFKNDDFNPFAGIKSGRPVADPKQTIQELATKLKTS
ncbi:hypothetical protein K0M31_006716 [Melipona bicolor]|uniref:Mos1 transposase HTH domain-containing protein n=1 Tax=Melipona bicolor TaxID=60889 RepID=A0AA40KL21_9HYME|nr:hypothetical protein K0M31_006716 [Melipona bicolor]